MTNEAGPLNKLLRDELAAVDAYRRAMGHVRDPDARDELATALAAHERRAEALRGRVAAMGGAPATRPAGWGAILAFLERGASLLGDRMAVAVLEGEEERGLARYRANLPRLDPESHELVRMKLLPDQEQTYFALSTLRMALH